MSQITSGAHAILSNPFVYDAFQRLMGDDAARREYATVDIRAKEGDYVLDIGCGTARMLEYLPRGIQYYGYDISERYIEAARRRAFHDSKLTVGMLTPEIARSLPKFDIVLAVGLLHHLEDDDAQRLCALAGSCLKRNGRFVTLDAVFHEGQNSIARFFAKHDRGRNVRTPAAYAAILKTQFPVVSGRIRTQLWMPMSQWIMQGTNQGPPS